MFEGAVCRKFADVNRRYNLIPIADLNSLKGAARIVLLLLMSLLLASAAHNVLAQQSEMQLEKIEEASVVELPDEQEWIRLGNFRDAAGADYVLVKAEGLDRTALDADMKIQFLAATHQYIDSQLQRGASEHISFDIDYIVKNFVVADRIHEHAEDVSVATGKMYTQYKQLRFDGAVRDQMAGQWTEQKSKFRIMQMGLLGGGVLVVLSSASVFFRINHATRGFYAGRLRFFAMAVILMTVISGIYAGRLLPWY